MKWLCVLLLLAGAVQAEERSYKLAVISVPGLIGDEGEGEGTELSNTLIKRLAAKGVQVIPYHFKSARRAMLAYNNGDFDAIFPAGVGDVNLQGVPSAAVFSNEMVLFTSDEQPVLNSIEDLEGRSTVAPRGYFMPSHIAENPKINIVKSNSMQSAFLMLSRKRIDSVLSLKSIGENVMIEQGLLNVRHGDAVAYVFGAFMFHKNTGDGKLLHAYNNEIASMLKDGTYKKIMRDSHHSLLH